MMLLARKAITYVAEIHIFSLWVSNHNIGYCFPREEHLRGVVYKMKKKYSDFTATNMANMKELLKR